MPSLVNWTKTHFSAFAIVSSPLILSIHPSDENLDPILDIIGNKMAMGINQAWAGHPGSLAKEYAPVMPPAPPVKSGNTVIAVTCDKSDKTETEFKFDATAKQITRGGLCLSSTAWGNPLTLEKCGGADPKTKVKYFQQFTYNAKTKQFQSISGAGPPGSLKPYPCCLESAPGVGGLPSKAYVYRCGSGGAFEWTLDATTGTVSNVAGSCLAARDSVAPVPPAGVAGIQLWAKPLGNGKTAALFINGGKVPYPSTSILLTELNVTGSKASVTDVWTGDDAGAVTKGAWSTGIVASLDSRFVVFDTSAVAA